ncbi:MAG: hypothetical protein AAGA85_14635 [Bacteroidota bacterium]
MKKLLAFICLLSNLHALSQVIVIGEALPAWQEGYMDLHHINTGRGDAAFYVFPDVTTMLCDAGEMNPYGERIHSPRNSQIHPDYSKKPYEWIVDYIRMMHPAGEEANLDYGFITHFHDDHCGAWYAEAPRSQKGEYVLTGVTGVGDALPIGMMIDRGYPNYDYPVHTKQLIAELKVANPEYAERFRTLENYWSFLDYQTKQGMKAAMLRVGTDDQIVLTKNKGAYPSFSVKGIKANGTIWTGRGTETFEYFPDTTGVPWRQRPSENPLSLAIRIDYGKFKYFTGGDMPGIINLGGPKWNDVETPCAPAIGEVDVATLNHHGNRDSQNPFYVATLKPRVWVQQSWSSDHPGEEVYRRLTSRAVYPDDRDIFTLNLLDAAVNFIGPNLKRAYKSTEGHILIRVMPGGDQYYVIILDDENTERKVTKVFGPYGSKD